MKIRRFNLRHITLFYLCIVSFLLIAGPAYPSDKLKLKPGAKGKLCLECHEAFRKTLKSRFVHPLLKKGECTGCHVPHTSSHKNLLTASTTKLCYGCHEEVLPEKAHSAHKVVVEANCKECHDSHGSNNKFILKKSGSALCFDCHKNMSENVKSVRFKHKSLDKEKGCLNCHYPHASAKFTSLLRNEAPSLCLKCHKTNTPSFSKKHMDFRVADANCGSCHNPHGSNKKGMVFDIAHAAVIEKKCTVCHQKPTSRSPIKTKKRTTQLCRECHKDMANQTFNKSRVHWPLVDNVGCLNCHNPHATKEQKLLKGSIINVCGKCHSDTVERQVWSKNNPKNENLCEPVKKGNCIACHSPHASDNVLLVRESSISIGLCGRCHEWQTHSTHPIGEKIVDPRSKNLTVECLSCHRACGTGNKPSMLTFDNTYELCVRCHVERRR